MWQWQNNVQLQHFISWKCLYTCSVPRGCWGLSKGWNTPTQVPKPLMLIWENVPGSASAALAEQGPAVAFHFLQVQIHTLGTEGVLRHLQGMKCSNTSPKTIDTYIKKVPNSAYVAMAKQGQAIAFHHLEVSIHPLGTEGLLRLIQEVKWYDTSPKTINDYMRNSA